MTFLCNTKRGTRKNIATPRNGSGSKGPRWNERQGRQQLAVARDANEIARSAAYAASDAAAAARSQAHITRAPLIIATIALFVSITTPEKIVAYVSSKPWVSWFQNDFFPMMQSAWASRVHAIGAK
jgi:hypothetical protein